MNVKELKEIVDANSNDKLSEVFDELYMIIASRAKDGYNSYTTTRQQLGLTESEFLGVIARLSNDGYSVYMSDVPVKYVANPDDDELDNFCAFIATGFRKLRGVRTTQIKIVWKFDEE